MAISNNPVPRRRGGQATQPWWRSMSIVSWAALAVGLLCLGVAFHAFGDKVQVVTGGPEEATLAKRVQEPAHLRGTSALPQGPPVYVVGTHHKTGTALMALILREAQAVHQSLTGRSDGILMGYFGGPIEPGSPFSFYFCDSLYSDHWNESYNSTAYLPKLVDYENFFGNNYKFMHLVRDPLELVLSAYLYHYAGPPSYQEVWLYEKHPLSNYRTILQGSSCDTTGMNEMSWYDVLHCLNDEEGVRAEAVFQTYFGAIPSMVGAVKQLHHKPGAKVLQQGLEEYNADFDGALSRMLQFFDLPSHEVEKIVRTCSKYDLKRQSWSERQSNRHVTSGKRDRQQLREVVERFAESDKAFQEARRLLGYPKQEQRRYRST